LRFTQTIVLAAAAIVLLAPSLFWGTLDSQSAPQNLTWAAQFSEQFRAGILYPRWLPQSFDGLGSPTFYFYPPLSFWLDAVVRLVTFDTFPIAYRLSLDWALLLWSSGLAMRAWLLIETGRSRFALWGAVAYMAAPYHLLVDHYIRGAYAESTAYVFLPLVMLSIRRIGAQLPFGLPLLALSYGGLLISHLPSALLASSTVLPAYILFVGRRSSALAYIAIAMTMGVGLATIYLLPALTLQPWVSADQFWTRFYRVENWFLLMPNRWPEPVLMQIIASLAASACVLAVAICSVLSRRTAAFCWSMICLACLALMAGVIPWFWQLPALAKVQFPWRLMPIVEFALITSLALALGQLPRRIRVYGSAIALAVATPGLLYAFVVVSAAVDRASHTRERPMQDVKEYEPRGFPIAPGQSYVDLGLEPLKDTSLISCVPAVRICRATELRFGSIQLEVENDIATEVVLRRFYFPAWGLDRSIVLSPTEKYRLVSFVLPAGHTTARLHRDDLPIEHWAWAISALSLLLLLAAMAVTARNNTRRGNSGTDGGDRREHATTPG